MTALPPAVYLRRHALPAHFLADLGSQHPRSPVRLVAASPRLIATWHIGTEGRAVCRWSVADGNPVPSG